MREVTSKLHTGKVCGVKYIHIIFSAISNWLDYRWTSWYQFSVCPCIKQECHPVSFGLCWLGDGATIKKMLLINMLVMCGDKLPAVISICESTEHIVDNGKKDVKYIISLIPQKFTLIPFLMELQLCRKLVRYFVPTFHKQYVFMGGACLVTFAWVIMKKCGILMMKKMRINYCYSLKNNLMIPFKSTMSILWLYFKWFLMNNIVFYVYYIFNFGVFFDFICLDFTAGATPKITNIFAKKDMSGHVQCLCMYILWTFPAKLMESTLEIVWDCFGRGIMHPISIGR